MTTGEEWKTHPEYTSYDISTMGRCRNNVTGNLMSVGQQGRRRMVGLSKNLPAKIGRRISVLVLQTFVGTAPEGKKPTHLNGDVSDARLENLAWGNGNYRSGVGPIPDNCGVLGCQKYPAWRGYCLMHEVRMVKTGSRGSVELARKSIPKDHNGENVACSITVCTNKMVARGLCSKHYHLETRYNLDLCRIEEMSQKEVCSNPPCDSTKLLRVDHDHACCAGNGSCGECVRGWLCHGCNTTLGFMRDDPEMLRGLIMYLSDRKEAR